LVELTFVIGIFMGLISALLIGVTAYKNGAARASCVQNISSVQKAMRSYCNVNECFPGDAVTALKEEIFGVGKFLPSPPKCPGQGEYHFYGDGSISDEPAIIPQIGVLYMSCSIESHIPSNHDGW